jgi:hypothetical protein
MTITTTIKATEERIAKLVDELRDAPRDHAGWKTLAAELGNPGIGQALQRAALQKQAATPAAPAAAPATFVAHEVASPLGEEATRDYLGERLANGPPTYLVNPGFSLSSPPLSSALKPFGKGASSSRAAAARPGGGLVDASPLASDTLERVAPHLVRVGAGTTIDAINLLLDKENLALENISAFGGQTIAGAVNTATHGSGKDFGPICDQVESVTLCAADDTRYRIERTSGGPTDPRSYTGPHTLIQDDDVFHSVVVGLGCMGVVEDLVLRVVDAFPLTEVRVRTTWNEVKALLRAGRLLVHRHDELVVNPYTLDGENTCVWTQRTEAVAPNPLSVQRRRSRIIGDLLLGATEVAGQVMATLPGLAPHLVEALTAAYVDTTPRGGKSFDVLNLGPADSVRGVAAEIAFLMPNGDAEALIGAIDAIIQRANDPRRAHDYLHTAPMGVRFTRASPHYLAMQHGDPAKDIVGLVEELALYDAHREACIDAFQRDAIARGGRPHWGQRNQLMGGIMTAPTPAYPKVGAWLRARKRFDPQGRFDNEMTDTYELSLGPKAPPIEVAPAAEVVVAEGFPEIVAHARSLRDRKRLPFDESKAVKDSSVFVIDTDAVTFGNAFLAVKSKTPDNRFGPLQLTRDEGRDQQVFEVGERFQARTLLGERLRAEIAARLHFEIGSLDQGILGPIFHAFEDKLSSNYCELTKLEVPAPPGTNPNGAYDFLEGSPYPGRVTFVAEPIDAGRCRVTQTLAYVPDEEARLMMRYFGTRLTRVVGYVEVEAAATLLGKSILSSNIQPPTAVELADAPTSAVVPVDDGSIIAKKRDVRRFRVTGASAASFARVFYEQLSSNALDLGFFHIERPGGAVAPFKVGDTFVGKFTPNDELKQLLERLHPPTDANFLGSLAGKVWKKLFISTVEHSPPEDHGIVTQLVPADAPTYVRYDYVGDTLIAGHSAFSVERLGPSECRVTQEFVYQERTLSSVETFGTMGLFLHGLVVSHEIEAVAAKLGATAVPEPEDDDGVTPRAMT